MEPCSNPLLKHFIFSLDKIRTIDEHMEYAIGYAGKPSDIRMCLPSNIHFPSPDPWRVVIIRVTDYQTISQSRRARSGVIIVVHTHCNLC